MTSFPHRGRRLSAACGLTLAVAVGGGAAVFPGAASAQPTATGPTVKLVAAQRKLTLPQQGGDVILNPGVYVAAFGSQLRFDVERASYSRPVRIYQVIHLAGRGTVTRRLPGWTLDGWNGLRRFVRISVTNRAGNHFASLLEPFCPNSTNAQRADPDAPAGSPFPQLCQADPFPIGMVWGVQRGWGVDPIGGGYAFEGPVLKLKRGYYKVTVTITTRWRRLLHVTAANGTAIVRLHVVKPQPGCYLVCFGRSAVGLAPAAPRALRPPRKPRKPRPASGPSRPDPAAIPIMTNPPKADLPDLDPLPAWDVSVINTHSPSTYKAIAELDFGATVWIGGNARLDVEGFRVNGSSTMRAYQYFWHNGRVVGRDRVGTMGFSGYNHWHFKQFAQYRLLNAKKDVVVRSQKEGFCIGATDPINLLLPHASWQPGSLDLNTDCGQPSALAATETLPVGWGDTYFQTLPGQSFNITSLPNGRYFIQIVANPERLLHETSTSDDTSVREVILGGKPGNRTVRVPAYFGIDPEH
jgi:hypothetical protein